MNDDKQDLVGCLLIVSMVAIAMTFIATSSWWHLQAIKTKESEKTRRTEIRSQSIESMVPWSKRKNDK